MRGLVDDQDGVAMMNNGCANQCCTDKSMGVVCSTDGTSPPDANPSAPEATSPLVVAGNSGLTALSEDLDAIEPAEEKTQDY